MNKVYLSENLKILKSLPSNSVELIYIDPPFNTGNVQKRKGIQYEDSFTDFLGFLKPRLKEAYRILTDHGSLFFHIDYREVHYCKILLDMIFGRESFINEIIWSYDYGARSKSKWSTKHDNILWYAKDPKNYIFNYDEIDRIPYMSPKLVGPEKTAKGKTLTDVWWHTIVHTNGKEKTGYPTQKPLGVINRIVKVHSNPGETVLDFFAGSGTIGESAFINKRNFILIDREIKSIEIIKKRLKNIPFEFIF